ncbi:hypothetical protein [Rhodospirillaceae bacterium SYSU D60014]|uniref:hypothetical protein n=1 Tax=Virgifigura deserti TaxID=2268457 RepID=UPI000E66E640
MTPGHLEIIARQWRHVEAPRPVPRIDRPALFRIEHEDNWYFAGIIRTRRVPDLDPELGGAFTTTGVGRAIWLHLKQVSSLVDIRVSDHGQIETCLATAIAANPACGAFAFAVDDPVLGDALFHHLISIPSSRLLVDPGGEPPPIFEVTAQGDLPVFRTAPEGRRLIVGLVHGAEEHWNFARPTKAGHRTLWRLCLEAAARRDEPCRAALYFERDAVQQLERILRRPSGPVLGVPYATRREREILIDRLGAYGATPIR